MFAVEREQQYFCFFLSWNRCLDNKARFKGGGGAKRQSSIKVWKSNRSVPHLLCISFEPVSKTLRHLLLPLCHATWDILQHVSCYMVSFREAQAIVKMDRWTTWEYSAIISMFLTINKMICPVSQPFTLVMSRSCTNNQIILHKYGLIAKWTKCTLLVNLPPPSRRVQGQRLCWVC